MIILLLAVCVLPLALLMGVTFGILHGIILGLQGKVPQKPLPPATAPKRSLQTELRHRTKISPHDLFDPDDDSNSILDLPEDEIIQFANDTKKVPF